MDDGEDLFSSAKIKWFQTRAQGGVTQLQFGTDNYTLFSLSRRSDAVLAWDVRMMTGQDSSRPICGIKSYATDHDTNQRLEFDFDENGRLVVGGRDNCVRIYDVPTGLLVDTLDGLHSAANGVSCHGSLVTVAVGSRVFPTVEDYDKEGDEEIVAAKGSLEMYKVTSVPFSGKDNGG
jgi:WD40 repeat protein